MCTAGLVCNQTYEDNEMMKKLLLCSNNCQDDNDVDEDDADVIVESLQEKSHSLKSFCNEVESLENLNFNYEVIVKFVKQGNNQSVIIIVTRLDLNVSPRCPAFSGMRDSVTRVTREASQFSTVSAFRFPPPQSQHFHYFHRHCNYPLKTNLVRKC